MSAPVCQDPDQEEQQQQASEQPPPVSSTEPPASTTPAAQPPGAANPNDNPLLYTPAPATGGSSQDPQMSLPPPGYDPNTDPNQCNSLYPNNCPPGPDVGPSGAAVEGAWHAGSEALAHGLEHVAPEGIGPALGPALGNLFRTGDNPGRFHCTCPTCGYQGPVYPDDGSSATMAGTDVHTHKEQFPDHAPTIEKVDE
jgi:hypothetical protein